MDIFSYPSTSRPTLVNGCSGILAVLDSKPSKNNDKYNEKDNDKYIKRTLWKSNLWDPWPLRHLIRMMRKYDLTKKGHDKYKYKDNDNDNFNDKDI